MTAPTEWQPPEASTACKKCGITRWELKYSSTYRAINGATTMGFTDKLVLSCRRCGYEKLANPKTAG